ncbi:MAG: bifunctional nuclease family protein [Candidatus Omnitrophica bacterium]|nr:bifunctional nuclease family protein [Candidatus Omnitrophota bacterium]
MIEVVISKIKIDELHEGQMIFLKEKDGERVLPVVIGIAEISSIKYKLSGVVMPRPLTHDLLSSVIKSVNASVNYVVIDKLEDNTFFAKISLKKENGETVAVDARPSDSIALAIRDDVSIFVEDDVMNIAGIYLNGGT